MKLTKKEYSIAFYFLQWLQHRNYKEHAEITLIKDIEIRKEKIKELEDEAHAINILIQLLTNN